MTREINVARDFHTHPLGRYPAHGPWNGERFRQEYLIPALQENAKVKVDLTGARGLAPSFLEESFGGLVRAGFSGAEIKGRVEVVSETDPSLVIEIETYIDDAERLAQNGR